MELSSSGESGPSPEGQDQLYAVVRATLGSAAATAQAPAIDEARERLSVRVAREGRVRGAGRTGLSGLLRLPRGGWSRHGGLSGTQTLQWTRAVRLRLWAGILVAAALVIIALGVPRSFVMSGLTKTYATTTGNQATITLHDGTRITLAPRTTLRLANFSARSRTVWLDGEAYFEIPRAAGVPFIVRSGPVVTRVLGTAFTMRAYSGDAHARVAVTTGKVTVSSSMARFAPVTLAAGYLGDVTDSTITVKASKTGDELAQETSWMHGRLVFHDTPVPEVLATLNRWYGYQFRCSDPSVMQQDLTVALSAQSSSAALAILEQVLNVNLTVVGDTVNMTPRHSPPVHGTTRTRSYDIWTPIKEAGR